MRYAYEDLGPGQFEHLVVALCQFLLGAGTQGFATGPDGGRDAKFVGTADLLPSKAAPWSGTVVIQAKHTNGINKSFTDPDFFSERSGTAVITVELPRITRLWAAGSLDHYVLFANRRLTGQGESVIRAYVAEKSGLPMESVLLCGVEQLEVWLRRFPQAVGMACIDAVDSPLIISSDELAEIVEVLSTSLGSVLPRLDDMPAGRIPYAEKNRVNKMTDAYARELRKRYLKETQQIRDFLANPINERMLELYMSTVEEFQLTVVAKRKDYQTFDDVMDYLFKLLFARDPLLRAHKRLTRAMVFYMYWNCDLGDDGGA